LEVKGDLPVLKLPERGKTGLRPDYELARAKERAAGIEQGLAAARRVPDVTAGLFAAREAQQVNNSGRERTGFFGLRFSVPLPLWNKNEGEIAEKAASAARAKSATEALVLQIDGETGTAWREMEANASIVAETKEKLLPLAAQQVADLDKAYKEGQVELLTLLRAREQQIELQSVVLDAERDFHLARIRHQSAIGGQP
jgi:cobalt-zinc-cadmium efflux system outer membrane protein